MGFFSLTSKKASATLIFLIISVLVISSSAIIVYEVKKTNDKVIGTGLVLLDEIQHAEERQIDNFKDEVDNNNLFSFTVDKKDISKDSSKSEKSKESSEDDLNSADYDLEFLSNLGENSFVKEDFTEISDQIFSRNGTDYILRDDIEYKLASSDAKSSEISFNPALPSSVCVGASGNEKIDIGIQGGFYVSGNSETYGFCYSITSTKSIPAKLTLRIKEYDFWSDDDVIETRYFTVYVPCDEFYSGTGYVSYSNIFEDVDLSSQFTGVGAIEVYGLVELTSSYLTTKEFSTTNYKINKEPDCQCISGSCCYLGSRPYRYKSYGSQPTDYEDYYTCDGTSSPTGISYVEFIDWYCSGNYNEAYLDKTYKDTCGTCEYCKVGYSSCYFYYQNEKCGIKDCDYLDTDCRDYHDVNKVCTGGGACTSLSCNSYTNEGKGTPCGTNKECDGSGNCVSASIECTLNSECGTDGWIGSTFCASNDVYQGYRSYRCYNSGTTSSYCSNTDTNEKKQECGTPGCSNGVCNSQSCTAHSTSSCYGGDVYWYDSCGVREEKRQECGTLGCSNGECNEVTCLDSVCGGYCGDYSSYPNWRFYNLNCISECYHFCGGNCRYSNAEYCEFGCENGQCKEVIECYSNNDCGTDAWVGSAFCSSDDVYQKYRTYTCHNPGTSSSYCSYSDTSQLKQDCGTSGYTGNNYCYSNDVYRDYLTKGCSGLSCTSSTSRIKQEECGSDSCGSWGADYCKGEDVYHKRTCHDRGCSGSSCFDNTYIEEERVQNCQNGCTENRCKVETCETVCSYGGCEEYCGWV